MTKEEAIKLIDDRMCFGRGKWSEHHKPEIDIYWQAGEMAIKALEAEPHWIPVTERLPDNSRNVLITIRGGVSMAWYNGSYFEKGANTHHRKMQTVTAWCELPEPYKGVTE